MKTTTRQLPRRRPVLATAYFADGSALEGTVRSWRDVRRFRLEHPRAIAVDVRLSAPAGPR